MGPSRPRVLCVGGSDPLGGAGLQMDAAVCTALGGEPLCVAAIDTVQRARGLESVERNPPQDVARAMLRALERGVHAVKLGALGDATLTSAVVETLEPWLEDGHLPLVIDPVAAATRTTSPELVLNTPKGLRLLGERLFRYALVTPNAFEYGDGSRYVECLALLRTGGHEPDWDAFAAGEEAPRSAQVVDRYSSVAGDQAEFGHPRVAGATGLHGTGCALAAAAATLMGWGFETRGAAQHAVEALGQWLAAADDRLVPFAPEGETWRELLR